jgi:hypothetical protein
MTFQTNADIERMEDAERARLRAESIQNEPMVLGLASHIRSSWQSNKDGKIEVETRLLKALRQRNGDYDPDLKQKILQHGGSNIFMMITAMKCRACEAWLKDVMLPPGEKPWGIDPTPYPELPVNVEEQIEELVMYETAEVMTVTGSIDGVTVEQIRDRVQEVRDNIIREHKEIAREAANRYEVRIEDELREGGFYQAYEKFITDLVTFPTAFLKGPVTRSRKTLQWDFNENNEAIPVVKTVLRREWDWVSPFDLYPSKGAKSLQDGNLIERLRFRRSELQALKGVPGYNSAAIDAALWLYGQGGLKDWLWTDQERSEIESRPQMHMDPEPVIDALLFWGTAQGRMLREWGMSEEDVPNLHNDYQVCAMLIGNFVVMAQLNPHPLDERPYFSASYEKMNNSIWGKAIPELMADIQRLCNAAARSLANNMAIASGPLVEVHTDRLAAGFNVEEIYPWMILKTERDQNAQRDSPAVYFYQPKSNADVLMRVYQYWFDQASEVTGVPAYFQGSEKGIRGAGKTASGLAMLMNTATKTLKGVVFNADFGVTIPAIKEEYLNLMLYDDTIEKTGDINIIARASEYLIMQEQLQVRVMELLNFTNNDRDAAIMGMPGRAHLLREAVKMSKVPAPEKVVPTEAALLEAMQQSQEQEEAAMAGSVPPPAVPPGPGGGRQPQQRVTNINQAGMPMGGMQPGHMPVGGPPGTRQ